MERFKLLDNEYIPLCDLLKRAGACQTGGHAKVVISNGEVKVDNKVELRKRCKIRPGQIVEFNGLKIEVFK